MGYYSPALGACNIRSNPFDSVVQVAPGLFDARNCQGTVIVKYQGKKTMARMVDLCTVVTPDLKCDGENDLNASPALFNRFASTSEKQIDVVWYFE
ncbi:hypothetical protein MMC20_002962 [Loxospora ochrophaea]|nr:hypothetical protein [Loxospora ochrophaea]